MGLEPAEVFRPLGTHAIGVLDRWLDKSGRRLLLDKWLAGGSGAAVALIYVNEPGAGVPVRKAVLKLCPPGENTEGEFLNSKEAWNGAPPDFRSHLAKPLWEPIEVPTDGTPGDSSWLMFQSLAGGSSTKITQFSQLPWKRRALAYPLVARALLDDWGQAHTVFHEVSVRAFVKGLLHRRLDSGEPLREWAAHNSSLVEEPAVELVLPDEALPMVNPFLLTMPGSLGDRKLRCVFTGKAHGDLNLGNVLVPTSDALNDFVLIDLARYSAEAPLARDPVQFLLCIIASRLADPQCDAGERAALLRVLAHPESSAGDMVLPELWDVISSYRKIIPVWVQEGSLPDEWAENQSLSLVACALMFCGRKGVSDEDRMWFLRLAAHAATHHVEEEANVEDWRDGRPTGVARTLGSEESDARPDRNDNVVYPDFERRPEARQAAPPSHSGAEAMRLIERLTVDAGRLSAEVAGLPLLSSGKDLHIRATTARYLVATVVKVAHDLVALRLDQDLTDYREQIAYIEALEDLRKQVDGTRKQVFALGTPGGESADVPGVRLTAERLRQLAADLCAAVHCLG
ncbi:hypothetical protein [Streptomyces sp. NPDC003006]